MKSYMIYRRYTIDLIFRGGWMSKKWIIFSIIVAFIVITILAIVAIHAPEGNSKIGEIVKLVLQMSAVCATIAVSTWGLTIAHRKNKHWELDKCDDLWEEHNKINRNSIQDVLIFWEKIALLEKKSYLDTEILYDRFYPDLLGFLKKSNFYNQLKEHYKDSTLTSYHTRTLYIKWKDRYEDDMKNIDLENSWNKMWKLIRKAKEKEIEQLETQIKQLDKTKEKEIQELERDLAILKEGLKTIIEMAEL